MNNQELIDHLQHLDTNKVKVAIADIDGLLRGKVLHRDKVINALTDGFGFCDVVFGWDSTDSLYGHDSVTGWHKGFPDARATLDPNTFRRLPWDDGTPLLLADFENSLANICPRTLLKKQVKKAEKLGYNTCFSMEFEWFNFFRREENQQPISEGMFGYSLLRSSQFDPYWSQLFDQLETADIQLEGLHTETGPGAMEAAIMKDDALAAADKAILFKTAVKSISSQHSILASFMAKWNTDFPGCSGHIHQSLWTDSTNLFSDDSGNLSPLMQSYLAGILYTLPYLMPLYAPTINSYKRLTPGTWAPTSVSWGIDNRTTACRVIKGGKESRIELRVSGADNNPFLSMAAALASGLYGIQHNLTLDEEVAGNAYKKHDLIPLPGTLKEATDQMKKSLVARELFGNEFVDHFTMTREWEVSLHEKQVSDWEVKRYFEGI